MGPTVGEPIGPPHLPWTIYAYGPDGFAQKRAMPRNPNVMGYPFPSNTRAVSSFSFCPSLCVIPLFLFQSLTLLSLNCKPPSKSMRSLYGWLGILS